VIVPYFADQPFWGWRVEKLGVGPKPIPRRRLSAEKLAGAIQQAVNDAGMQRRAEALGAQLKAEDGVTETVRLVERYLNQWPQGFHDPFQP
jgi:sterol 3beta-glucosyltransferase